MKDFLFSIFFVMTLAHASQQWEEEKLVNIALGSLQKLNLQFIEDVEFSLSNPSLVKTIQYGNSSYGYFETNNFISSKEGVLFSFIPPGRKKAIEFYAVYEGGERVNLGTRTFDNFLPPFIRFTDYVVKRPMSVPFMLGSGKFPVSRKGEKIQFQTFPVILNRLGEVVWAYVPHKKAAFRKGSPVLNMIRPGRLAILYPHQGFEVIDIKKGLELTRYFPKSILQTSQSYHHDFEPTRDDKTILVLKNEIEGLRDIAPLFYQKESLSDFWQDIILLFSPIQWVKSPYLIKYDFLSGKEKERIPLSNSLFSTISSFQYIHSPKVEELRRRKIQTLLPPNLRGSQKFEDKGLDVYHVNSFHQYKGRTLVSMPYLCLLLELDEKGEGLFIGSKKLGLFFENPKDQFCLQHHVSYLSENEILLFDNYGPTLFKGEAQSRVLKLEITRSERRVRKIWEYNLGEMSHSRGSAFKLVNENLFIYAPADKSKQTQMYVGKVFEISQKDGKIQGEIQIKTPKLANEDFFEMSDSYKYRPLYQIHDEKFVGYIR